MTGTSDAAGGALAGYRILDLTTVLFGPLGTQTLADWGADVIKIESTSGDLWRSTGQFRNRGMSGQFMAVNRNKRSLALDLRTPEGKAILETLITGADALVSNVRPAGLARLGFSFEDCQRLNPRLIYASATGFGQDGPWAARPAFDEIIQAASGFASAIGSDETPAFVPSLVADKVCAMALTSAVTAALLHRERTGQGQRVEIPMLETLASFNSIEMLGGTAFVPPIGPARYKRVKERHPAQTSDGWITMLPYTAGHWQAFFEAVGQPERMEEFGIHDPVRRAANIDAVYQCMREIAAERTTAEWESLLLKLDIPHAAFTKVTEVAEQPHLHDVGLFQQVEHPTEGALLQARPPTRFSASPASVRSLAPTLGQHTRELLDEIGYSADHIDDLFAKGVIAEEVARTTGS